MTEDENPTMLRHMGPMPGGGFGMELEGGPIPAIAEYLANMLGMRTDEPSNYVEMHVNRADLGAMTLTLQRCSGRSPHQLRKDAEDRVAALEAKHRWRDAAMAPRNGTEFQAWVRHTEDGQGWWEPKCRFDPEHGAFEIWRRTDYDQEGWDCLWHIRPVAWMPHPEAPTPQEPPHAGE